MKYIQLLRPGQWTKNIFVLLPLIFSGIPMGEGTTLLRIALAFVAFCLWSSGIYVLNDLVDSERDRSHPRKRFRPIAAGTVSPLQAMMIAPVLMLLPFAILEITAWFWPSVFISRKSLSLFFATGAGYLVNNILYCFILRKKVVLDVISIATGFLLRVLAGCFILAVQPSVWIMACTFTLALFLGFGKRRMELVRQAEGERERGEYRLVLNVYTREMLNLLLGITAAVSLICYLLYTVSPATIAIHQTSLLILTVPFVFYGIFRYICLSLTGKMDGPDEVLLKDIPFIINGLLWCLTVFLVFYLRR